MRPRHRTLHIARFHYFGRRGRWREADEAVARVIALDPKDAWAHSYHCALLLFLGDVEGCRRAYREAVAVGEGDALTYVEYFLLLGRFPLEQRRGPGPPPPSAGQVV